MCADTRLIPSWRVGDRTVETAIPFLVDLRSRLKNRVQLTSDGHKPYLQAVHATFGRDVDYAMLVKVFGSAEKEEKWPSAVVVLGAPDLDRICTSYMERGNLTIRMAKRRFTRLTNGFSKKLANHINSFAMWSLAYNFARVHRTLKTTPAVAAGVVGQLWSYRDVIALIDERTSKPGPRGPYGPRRRAVDQQPTSAVGS